MRRLHDLVREQNIAGIVGQQKRLRPHLWPCGYQGSLPRACPLAIHNDSLAGGRIWHGSLHQKPGHGRPGRWGPYVVRQRKGQQHIMCVDLPVPRAGAGWRVRLVPPECLMRPRSGLAPWAKTTATTLYDNRCANRCLILAVRSAPTHVCARRPAVVPGSAFRIGNAEVRQPKTTATIWSRSRPSRGTTRRCPGAVRRVV